MQASDWIGIAGIVVGALSIFTTIILFALTRKEKQALQREKKQEERAEFRKQESLLSMKWQSSMSNAIEEIAKVLKPLGANGDLARAVSKVKECSSDMDDYLCRQNAQINH